MISPYLNSSWRLTPKQDFLVCFLGGNLLLSATRTGALVRADDVNVGVSIPPRAEELSDVGRRDWTTGIELIRTCMATHDTKTYVICRRRQDWRLIKRTAPYDGRTGDSHQRLRISESRATTWVWRGTFLAIGTLKAQGAGFYTLFYGIEVHRRS
jgi:hypothetical protein